MNFFIKTVVLFLLTAVGSFAAGVAVANDSASQEVLRCKTKTGKSLSITRNTADKFTVLYEDRTPIIFVVKDGNNMGTSWRYSAAEHTSNREIYFELEGHRFGIVGVTDDGKNQTAYFMVNHEESSLINDECEGDIPVNRFGESELFKNFTEVDEE